MNNINVKSDKYFYHGFVLTEQELRRIDNIIIEQFKKGSTKTPQSSYSILYSSGVFGQTNNIEDVFSQENSGTSKIVELNFLYLTGDDRKLNIQFSNIEADNIPSNVSIKYNIKSKSRDWGFIMSSILDERIKKVKRFNINFSPKNNFGRLLSSTFLFLIFIVGFTIPLLLSVVKSKVETQKIKNDWLSGKLTDPIEAIIRFQENDYSVLMLSDLKVSLLISFSLIFILTLIILFFKKLHTPCNFNWGDYLEVFSRKEQLKKLILIGVILSLIISIIGGIITNVIT